EDLARRSQLVAGSGQLITQPFDLGCRPCIEGRVLAGQPFFLPLDHSASPDVVYPKGSTSAPVSSQSSRLTTPFLRRRCRSASSRNPLTSWAEFPEKRWPPGRVVTPLR